MSLVKAMMRMTAVHALRGRTIAGPFVTASTIEALASVMETAKHPAILLRIDESSESGENEGFFATSSRITFGADLVVASRIVYEVEQEEGPARTVEEIVIEPTDDGLEFTLDLLDRQWRRALSDPDNAFGEAFRGLAATIGPVKSQRGVDPETGRKHAIRMIEIEIEPICDVAPGYPIPQAIEDALDLLATVEDYKRAVAIIRDEYGKGTALMSWQKVQATLFATAAVPGMLGVAPPDAGEVVELEQAGVVVNGAGGDFVDESP
jgi:hypothetical protein